MFIGKEANTEVQLGRDGRAGLMGGHSGVVVVVVLFGG